MAEIDTSIYRTAPAKSPMDQINEIQDFQQKKLNMAVGQQKYISNVLGSLYGKPDLSVDDIIREGSKAVQMGIIPQQQLGVMLQGLPQDPQQLRQWVGGMALRAASAGEQLEAHAGRAGTINNGAYDVGVRTSVMDGSRTYAPGNAGAVPMQVSPGQAVERTTRYKNGVPETVPSVAAAADDGTLNRNGSVPIAPPNAPGNRLTAPIVQEKPPNKLNVTAPVAPRPQVPPQIDPNIPVQRDPGPPAATPAAPAAQPYGGLPTAAGAGLQTGLPQGSGTIAEASANQFTALQKAADGARDRKAIMQNMEDHLKNFTPGIVGEKLGTGQAIVNGIANGLGKGDVFEGVADRQQFDKLSATLQQQRAALGVSSDAGLANAGASTPNSRYTKAGIEGMLVTLKGNEDAIQVKNQEAAKWLADPKHGPNSYGAFQQKFNSEFEPRVFALQYMTPQARAEMVKGMNEAESKSLDAAYKAAVKNGWIKRVGGN